MYITKLQVVLLTTTTCSFMYTMLQIKLNNLQQQIMSMIRHFHYKKSVLLRQFFCDGCKNRRYMSHIAAFFGIAIVHKVYCSVFWDDHYRYGFLRRPTMAGHKTTAIYMF